MFCELKIIINKETRNFSSLRRTTSSMQILLLLIPGTSSKSSSQINKVSSPAFADVEFAGELTNDIPRGVVGGEMNHFDSIFVFRRLAQARGQLEEHGQVVSPDHPIAVRVDFQSPTQTGDVERLGVNRISALLQLALKIKRLLIDMLKLKLSG